MPEVQADLVSDSHRGYRSLICPTVHPASASYFLGPVPLAFTTRSRACPHGMVVPGLSHTRIPLPPHLLDVHLSIAQPLFFFCPCHPCQQLRPLGLERLWLPREHPHPPLLSWLGERNVGWELWPIRVQ